MTAKTGDEVRIDALEADVEKLDHRVGVIERATTWAIGAAMGIGAFAAAIMSGVFKRLAE